MIYNPLFVFLQSPKWYTFGLQFGIFMRYYLHHIFQNSFAHDKLTGGANKAFWFKVLDIAPSWFWYFGTGNGDILW